MTSRKRFLLPKSQQRRKAKRSLLQAVANSITAKSGLLYHSPADFASKNRPISYCYNATWILPASTIISCCISSCDSSVEHKRQIGSNGTLANPNLRFALCRLPADPAGRLRGQALAAGGRPCGRLGQPSVCWQPKGDKRDSWGHRTNIRSVGSVVLLCFLQDVRRTHPAGLQLLHQLLSRPLRAYRIADFPLIPPN